MKTAKKETTENDSETAFVDEMPAAEEQKTTEKEAATSPRFSKSQLLKSPDLIDGRGILLSQLKDDEKYTKAEAKKIISEFRKTKL